MPRQNEPRERQCIVTREVRPVAELLRFVAAPDGAVVLDLKRTLPGRGAWLTAQDSIVRKAIAKNAFGRTLDGVTRPGPDYADHVAEQLIQSTLAALSLTRKAGALVTGFDQVEAALRQNKVAIVLQAAEAGADGTSKIEALVRRPGPAGGRIPVMRRLTERQLSLALGRPHVIHAAVLAGRANRHALDEIERLARFFDSEPGETSPTFVTTRGSDRRAETI